MERAVFLDRDGVLNKSDVRDGLPYAPRTLEEFALLPGVVEATRRLREAGFRLIVVTNQPDVGAGKVQRSVIESMHDRLRAWLPIDSIEVCYHQDCDACDCRKPKPGLLLGAANRMSISLRDSYVVGDRWRDIAAGQEAGCRTILVDYRYEERQAEAPDFVVTSLSDAVPIIIGT
ncbi:MAG: HAD family hydrolase [Verrucomicrobia bacterium]|nr:HAD family hydrolase [Verrucomicrobiota bacterium]